MQNNLTNKSRQERSASRATIMAAARALASRDGVENLTLSRVAAEAGLQRVVVYSQFMRKEDLLTSIVCEDLSTLARSMRKMDWLPHEGGDTPETAVILSLTRPSEADTPPAETSTEVIDLAKDVSAALAGAPQTTVDINSAGPQQERHLARRANLIRVLGGLAPVPHENTEVREERFPNPEAPVIETPAEKPVARAPDAWLERRLRVFERAMTAMEACQEQVEKNSRTACAIAEENSKTLEATVKELNDRADAADARHKASSNEIRGALNETALRLQTVEGVARAALAENCPVEEPQPAAQPEVPQTKTEEAPQPRAEDAAPTGEMLSPNAPKSFIAEARKSVIAASAAAEEADTATEAKTEKERKNITRYLLGGLVVLVIFIAAAGMAFSKGVRDGRRDALNQLVRVAPRQIAALEPHQTPLDQLTARAQAGDAAAELTVAKKYLNGSDTPKDPAAAMRWFTLAAVHGQPVAQYMLGMLYQQGIGTPSNPAKALQWYEAAALQGNRKAMHDLAIAYAEGMGTSKNLSEAVRWFSRAAGFGYVDSQFNLAVLYERGDGVPQSLLDAYKWYVVAGRQGDAESKQRIEALRTQLSADDLAAAQHAADTFRALPYDVAANTLPNG